MKLVTFQDGFIERVGTITDKDEIFNLSSFDNIPDTVREILEAGEPMIKEVKQTLSSFGELNLNIQ